MTPEHLVCPVCLLDDAKRADQAARLLMPTGDQCGTAGADSARKQAMTRLADRNRAIRKLVTATRTDWDGFRFLLARGLSALLSKVAEKPAEAAWLARHGVRHGCQGWTCGRSERSTDAASE